MKVKIEFSGGLELMFEGKKNIDLDMEKKDDKDILLEDVIDELKTNHLKEKEELFVQAGTIRPGIIVLVNDTDWELLDNEKYKVEENDVVAFISTLHGG